MRDETNDNSQLIINNSQFTKGYKQTEIGIIPEDWEVSTVGREFEIQLGKRLDEVNNVGVLKPYVPNKSVQWDKIDIEELPLVPLTPLDLKRLRLRQDDLLVCEGGEAGRAAIWNCPIDECYYQNTLHRLRPLRKFNSKFFLELLRSWTSRNLLANYISQTSIAHLTREKFAEVPLPFPPLAEQEAIAEVLSDADALINSLDRLITKKRNIKQGTMQLLLTGKKRLPNFNGDWETKTLGEIGEFKNGINKGKDDFGFGFPFVNLMDVFGISKVFPNLKLGLVNSSVAERKMYELKKGDVLFVRSSVKPEGVGLTSLITTYLDNTVYSGFLIRFRDNGNLNFEFKEHCFFEEGFRQRLIDSSTVSANTNINQEALKKLEIKLPPTIEEQKAIAEVLSGMDAEIEALEAKRDKYKALKQGMMQELLTGKTRLI